MEWKTFTFAAGAEWAPDSSHGLDVLRFDAAGHFHYENRMRDRVKTVSGTVAAGVLREIGWHLEQAAFPDVPPHDIPPGASLVEITLEDVSGFRTVRLDFHAARKFPGYRELLVRFDRWTTWLRGGGAGDAAPPGLNPAWGMPS